MTDKQIMIDGYSLKDLKDLLFTGQKLAISTKTFEKIIEELERKEQECERLKKALQKESELVQTWQQREKETHNVWLKASGRAICYLQTLCEIKEIVEKCSWTDGSGLFISRMEQILQKISEVFNEKV